MTSSQPSHSRTSGNQQNCRPPAAEILLATFAAWCHDVLRWRHAMWVYQQSEWRWIYMDHYPPRSQGRSIYSWLLTTSPSGQRSTRWRTRKLLPLQRWVYLPIWSSAAAAFWNFESKVFAEMCAILGVKKTRTTALHPQSDRIVKRLNWTLESQQVRW